MKKYLICLEADWSKDKVWVFGKNYKDWENTCNDMTRQDVIDRVKEYAWNSIKTPQRLLAQNNFYWVHNVSGSFKKEKFSIIEVEV